MPRFFGGRMIMKHAIGKDAVVPAAAGEDAGGVVPASRRPLREPMDDSLLDELLERSRDETGACG
jgi:hypothetical protein